MEIVHWPDTRQAPAPALVAFHRVQVACQRHVAPTEPIRTEDEEVGWFRHPPGEDARSLWIAMDGAGDPVGGAWLSGAAGAAANADLLVSPGQRPDRSRWQVAVSRAQRRASSRHGHGVRHVRRSGQPAVPGESGHGGRS